MQFDIKNSAIPSTIPHLITQEKKTQTFVKNIIYLFMSFYHYLPLSSTQSVPSSFASSTYASLLYNKEAHCLTCQNERKSWMPVISGRSSSLNDFSPSLNAEILWIYWYVKLWWPFYNYISDLIHVYGNCTINKFHQSFPTWKAVIGITDVNDYVNVLYIICHIQFKLTNLSTFLLLHIHTF